MRNNALLMLCCAVLPLASGCGGGGGDAHAQAGAEPGAVPVLRAGSGRIIGMLVDIAGKDTDEMRVVQVINGQLTVIVIGAAGANGERGIRGEPLYYASPDCTGQPYTAVRGLVTNKLRVASPAIELSDAQSASVDGYTGPFRAGLATAADLSGL